MQDTPPQWKPLKETTGMQAVKDIPGMQTLISNFLHAKYDSRTRTLKETTGTQALQETSAMQALKEIPGVQILKETAGQARDPRVEYTGHASPRRETGHANEFWRVLGSLGVGGPPAAAQPNPKITEIYPQSPTDNGPATPSFERQAPYVLLPSSSFMLKILRFYNCFRKWKKTHFSFFWPLEVGIRHFRPQTRIQRQRDRF